MSDDKLTAYLAEVEQEAHAFRYLSDERGHMSGTIGQLLAAVRAGLELAAEWDQESARADALAERRDAPAAIMLSTRAQSYRDNAFGIREAITKALLGEDGA